ncbi:hypothetical protein XENORESO_007770, partial [Xenotaenia resolanae]
KEEEEREERSEGEEQEDKDKNPRHSIFERVASSVRFPSFRRAVHGPEVRQQPMGQEESELPSDKELERSLTLTAFQNQPGRLSPLPASGRKKQRFLESLSMLWTFSTLLYLQLSG